MKNLFNDPKLNEGFQIDFSKLNEEQKQHVLKIFKARGTKFDDKFLKSFNSRENDTVSSLCYFESGNVIMLTGTSNAVTALPLIDYATLCRGAVQLEPKRITVCGIEKAEELMRYCGFITHGAEYTQREGAIQFEYRCKGFVHDAVKISPEEFEQRLRGVYPVVKESSATETVEGKPFEFVQDSPRKPSRPNRGDAC